GTVPAAVTAPLFVITGIIMIVSLVVEPWSRSNDVRLTGTKGAVIDRLTGHEESVYQLEPEVV
ncbi:hypothetical protein, partial [Arthrobacter sp. UYCu712]|uniref:hypothetical protein n=1 Tax=Arthrobacter sp. UYCu712 TaxID=3156340 RepID=UPI00339992D8